MTRQRILRIWKHFTIIWYAADPWRKPVTHCSLTEIPFCTVYAEYKRTFWFRLMIFHCILNYCSARHYCYLKAKVSLSLQILKIIKKEWFIMKENRKLLKEVLKGIQHDMTVPRMKRKNILSDSVQPIKLPNLPEAGHSYFLLRVFSYCGWL